MLYQLQDRVDEAEEAYLECLAIAEEQGDKADVAWNLDGLASIAQTRGEEEEALALMNRSLSLAREMGNRPDVRGTLIRIGMIHHDARNLEQARVAIEEAVKIARSLGRDSNLGLALHLYAQTMGAIEGGLPKALDAIREALELYTEMAEKNQNMNDLIEVARNLEADLEEQAAS